MKILVTGKNGQVGHELCRSLLPLGEVMAIDQAECDLSDGAAIRQLIKELKPDVIVNPAAYTAVDKAESEQTAAYLINAEAPRILGEEACKLGALVVHFSTDYVFDGCKDGDYTETDVTNPQSVYGATKLAGEQALLNTGAKHLMLRTSWVVGAHGNNFAKTMLRLASERDALNIVADQRGAPTSAALLADVTAHLVREEMRAESSTFPYGLYHLTAAGVTDWHAYACYVIERARKKGLPIKVPSSSIRPIRTEDYPTPAKRPANSRLNTRKLRETFGLHLPNWQIGIDQILDQIL